MYFLVKNLTLNSVNHIQVTCRRIVYKTSHKSDMPKEDENVSKYTARIFINDHFMNSDATDLSNLYHFDFLFNRAMASGLL